MGDSISGALCRGGILRRSGMLCRGGLPCRGVAQGPGATEVLQVGPGASNVVYFVKRQWQ